MASRFLSSVISVFFEYDTPRIVHIKSKKVGIFNRCLQLCIITYVIGYAIIYQKGYQEFENVRGAITTKLKGVARTSNLTTNSTFRIWDVADYVVPPQENNAFFVITNLIITEKQSLGTCEEDLGIPGADCTADPNICVKGEPFLTGDGFMTGNCINSLRNPGRNSCEIEAWCPTEDGALKPPNPPAIAEAENFTVFIKNNVEFPIFGVKRRNVPSFANETYLKSCRFDFGANDQCPIMQLKTIVEGSGGGDFSSIAVLGGVIQVIISWDCDLDHSEEKCLPKYTFRRLDSDADVLSKGYNFRYAHYFKDENGTEFRTLFKAYGIKFIMTLQGRAGQFRIVPLMTNVGSGLAILGVATIICDIFVLYFLKARHVYYEKKYLQVEGDDAYKTMTERIHDSDAADGEE